MAEPKVTSGGVTLGKATVTRKHVRRGQDTEKKSRVQTTVTGGDTKDKQVTIQLLTIEWRLQLALVVGGAVICSQDKI